MSEKYVNITIDGAKIRAVEGTTVLDTALDYGICIPHLCHMQGTESIGACRLCIVELIEGEQSKVITSCTLLVEDGMVVKAHTDKILKARKNIAELLVAEAPNSKAIQDIAARCGVTQVRYPFRNKDCVLCGRCVSVCVEWQSRSLGLVGRGDLRRIAFPFNERPDTCKRCWTCIDVCPMKITPCPGPMIKGEEYLCNRCITQLSMTEKSIDQCVWCDLGEGYNCKRMLKK